MLLPVLGRSESVAEAARQLLPGRPSAAVAAARAAASRRIASAVAVASTN